MARERRDATLVVAGSGPLLKPLKRHAVKLGLDGRVVFAGYVPESEKVEYYNLADLLLSLVDGGVRAHGRRGDVLRVAGRGLQPRLAA